MPVVQAKAKAKAKTKAAAGDVEALKPLYSNAAYHEKLQVWVDTLEQHPILLRLGGWTILCNLNVI